MPWKVSSVMEERLRFVARLLEGEEMSLSHQTESLERLNRALALAKPAYP
jgi:hypothetical protein